MAKTAKRVNITLPEEVHSLLQKAAQDHYGGNLSRFLADAGMFYAGVLRGIGESQKHHEMTNQH